MNLLVSKQMGNEMNVFTLARSLSVTSADFQVNVIRFNFQFSTNFSERAVTTNFSLPTFFYGHNAHSTINSTIFFFIQVQVVSLSASCHIFIFTFVFEMKNGVANLRWLLFASCRVRGIIR